MSITKPQKISYKELIKKFTAFFVDQEYEKQIAEEVAQRVNHLKDKMTRINSLDGLKNYICNEKDSLESLLFLLNISAEKFKRFITKMRIDKGMIVTSEWDLKRIRKLLLEKPDFMDEICDLLTNGAKSDKFRNIIPDFYRENFCIDIKTMERLANSEELRRLVKKGMEGRYNNGLGDRIFYLVERKVKKICDKQGLTYCSKKNVIMTNRVISIAIPNENNPKILIDISFNITTSSAQTKYKENELKTSKVIKTIAMSQGKEIILINFLDGAGWVARQSDMRDIYRCSDYVINLESLNLLEDIIKFHTNC